MASGASSRKREVCFCGTIVLSWYDAWEQKEVAWMPKQLVDQLPSLGIVYPDSNDLLVEQAHRMSRHVMDYPMHCLHDALCSWLLSIQPLCLDVCRLVEL
jgi:hypothetical protein